MGRLGLSRLRIDHQLCVAMIGGDQNVCIQLKKSLHHTPDALIDNLNSPFGGIKVTGVTHHVAVREVHKNEAVGVVVQLRKQCLGHLVGFHFRVAGKGGRIEFTGDFDVILAVIGRCGLAVEETRHMAVLLRFGDPKLTESGGSQDLTQ